jgi:hypothetical protein
MITNQVMKLAFVDRFPRSSHTGARKHFNDCPFQRCYRICQALVWRLANSKSEDPSRCSTGGNVVLMNILLSANAD